jgi:DNA-binding MarR family transcriptional regulator
LLRFKRVTKPRRSKESDEASAVERFCFLVSKDIRTALNRDLTRFGLQAQQAAVLMQCCHQGRAYPTLLVATVGTDTAGITGLLDKPEMKDLVIRKQSPLDHRSVIVQPTTAGRALLPRLSDVFRKLHDKLLAGFSKLEKTRLERMLL